MEYYAFESRGENRETAVKNFRAGAGQALREFIYVNVGYDPNTNVPQVWKQFHDRVSLVYNAVPSGYFGIFKEIADMIVTLAKPVCTLMTPLCLILAWGNAGPNIGLLTSMTYIMGNEKSLITSTQIISRKQHRTHGKFGATQKQHWVSFADGSAQTMLVTESLNPTY